MPTLREIRIDHDGVKPTGFCNIHPSWDSPITLLIHGFNESAKSAKDAFQNLLDSITKYRDSLLPFQFASNCYLVYWQGYSTLSFASNKAYWLTVANYPKHVPSAPVAAEGLKNYIDEFVILPAKASRGESVQVEVNIIAHSLGCRLTLELLKRYHNHPNIKFMTVILMAGAVPTVYLQDDSHPLKAGMTVPHKTVVLFSKKDRVLQLTFPIGQTLAVGESPWPIAVGRTGEPYDVDNSYGAWQIVRQTKNGHDGYFNDSLTSNEIVNALNLRALTPSPKYRIGPGSNDLPSRNLPKWR